MRVEGEAMINQAKLLTMAEAVKIAGITRQALYQALNRGDLTKRVVQVLSWRIDADELERWLKQRKR